MRSIIKLLDKKKAIACYNCLLHVMATLYVSNIKSRLKTYEGLKCNHYEENSGNLSRIALFVFI